MSIPASLGAAVYAGLTSESVISPEGIVAGAVAFLLGLVAIKGLIAVAERINFGGFVVGAGVLVVAGGIWQALVA